MENHFINVLSELKTLECISEKQLSELLNIRGGTLRTWRARGSGPKYIKGAGSKGSIRYPVESLKEWFSESSVRIDL